MASRRNSPETAAPLPESERKALSRGIAFVAICAAALSAPTLYLLACLIGYPPQLAWLLPASFDGYAGTSIWVGRRIARTHPAAKAARRNARLALLLTIAGNGLYHLLVLAGSSIPRGLHIGLLVTVSALPPFIVERLLHLNAIANGAGTGTDSGISRHVETAAGGTRAPAAPAPAVARQQRPATPALAPLPDAAPHPAPALAQDAQDDTGGGNVVTLTGSGRRSPGDWAQLALPLYRAHVTEHGTAPSAPALAQLLRNAHPALPVPRSERAERNIRAETEKLAKADAEPEREQEAG